MGWPYQQKPPMGWPLDLNHPLAGFVAFWPMLEGSGGQVIDLSGRGNPGTLQGTTSWTTGKFGPCLTNSSENGSGIDITGLTTGTTFTVIIWAKSPTVTDDYIFDSESGRFLLADDADGTFRWYDGAFHDSGYNIVDGLWHQLAAVRTGAPGELFVDGISRYTDTGTAKSIGGTTIIGARYGLDEGACWKGEISHAMIYNRALSASEIALLYRQPFCVFKDPAEVALLGAYQVAVGTILPQITTAYMRISA